MNYKAEIIRLIEHVKDETFLRRIYIIIAKHLGLRK